MCVCVCVSNCVLFRAWLCSTCNISLGLESKVVFHPCNDFIIVCTSRLVRVLWPFPLYYYAITLYRCAVYVLYLPYDHLTRPHSHTTSSITKLSAGFCAQRNKPSCWFELNFSNSIICAMLTGKKERERGRKEVGGFSDSWDTVRDCGHNKLKHSLLPWKNNNANNKNHERTTI